MAEKSRHVRILPFTWLHVPSPVMVILGLMGPIMIFMLLCDYRIKNRLIENTYEYANKQPSFIPRM